jgi:hypothetical protein
LMRDTGNLLPFVTGEVQKCGGESRRDHP